MGGAGEHLPTLVLALSGIFTVLAVGISSFSIYLQLKNYRKPILQRMVIRIMIMVPLYAVSSLLALFSLEAAFVIDCIRDIYEAFVIYCFFVLLLSYLGGERSLLILLHGRPPKAPVFPVSLFKREIDVSDPHVFLLLKRGILQYVQLKPVLAVATLILKSVGKYDEGTFKFNSGYLYISAVYNTSICLSLYSLAVFWMVVSDDVKPFRPVPKFLCVKGILFFSFWQSIAISILVTAGVIKKFGPYTDLEHVSLGLTDTLICFEMPLFAWAHLFAFSHKDFIDPHRAFVARMPMYYAFRDAFGMLDVLEDGKATLRGQGMDYRDFEPAEGFMHQGDGRDRRIRAGLRYSKGGKSKYWLPKTNAETQPPGTAERGVQRAITRVVGRHQGEEVYAPLLEEDAEDVVHLAPDLLEQEQISIWGEPHAVDGFDLPFGDSDNADDELFEHSRKYLFGDYFYPVIDISSESARGTIWDEEERILTHERSAWYHPRRQGNAVGPPPARVGGYGAVGKSNPRSTPSDSQSSQSGPKGKGVDRTTVDFRVTSSMSPTSPRSRGLDSRSNSNASSFGGGKRRSPPSMSRNNSSTNVKSPTTVLPPDAVDLIVEDDAAAEEERTRERRKGEPAVHGAALRKVYRRGFVAEAGDGRRTEGEVQVHGERDRTPSPGRKADGAVYAVEDSDEEEEETKAMRAEDEAIDVAEGIARAVTPPIHARLDIASEDNPWA